MRGFGAPQAMFVIESAIARAAEALGVPAADIQRRNLLADGDPFPYGMQVERSQARRAFAELEARADVAGRRREIDTFNRDHALTKRGLALMPVCFGISFTSTFLNQASALVHVYTDGSVSVSTAAVEMGQGVNTKIAGIAVRTLGVPAHRIRIETTNTTRVANTSPTAASSGADMNGRATELACRAILDRLLRVAADQLGVRKAARQHLAPRLEAVRRHHHHQRRGGIRTPQRRERVLEDRPSGHPLRELVAAEARAAAAGDADQCEVDAHRSPRPEPRCSVLGVLRAIQDAGSLPPPASAPGRRVEYAESASCERAIFGDFGATFFLAGC